MKLYHSYFDVMKHLKEEREGDFTWTSIHGTRLAEVMELASNKGYRYHLNCYDETKFIICFNVTVHRRELVFHKEGRHSKNLITLTGKDGNNVLINVDRIDGVIDYKDGIRLVYMGGCSTPFNVKESMDQIESICNHNVIMNSDSVTSE